MGLRLEKQCFRILRTSLTVTVSFHKTFNNLAHYPLMLDLKIVMYVSFNCSVLQTEALQMSSITCVSAVTAHLWLYKKGL